MATKDITDRQVLLAVEQWQNNQYGLLAYEILELKTGEARKVCIAAIERAYDRGLIGIGVNLKTAWITEKGDTLLCQTSNQH